MYRIFYEERVRKDLKKIPGNFTNIVLASVNKLAANPVPHGYKKIAGQKGLYRIRQGDYRIVYTINHSAREIKIILIRHRKDSYRNF